MATVVNPKFVAPKPAAPAAPKTSYNTPAVIAKPAAAASSNFTYGSGNPQYVAPVKKVTGGSSSNQAAIDAANKQLLSDQKLLNDLLNQYVAGNTGGGAPGGGQPGGAPSGGKGAYTLEQVGAYMDANNGATPPDFNLIASGITNEQFSNWYNNKTGATKKTDDSVTSASTAVTRTLALDTFKATLGLLFGKDEVGKAYVAKLYSLVSGFYKTGSEVDEAINLALYQAESENAIPEFTSRFKGIFALRDAKQKGAAISVPTIAEFFATEAKMGEVLTGAGLSDLATESFLGDVIGKQKSVNEVASLISDVFNTIDYAPRELKATLSTYFPGVDRVSIARAILTGPEGAQALSKKIKGVSVLSAGQQYGIPVDLATATDIANRGFDYNSALAGFGQVSSLGRAGELARIGGGDFTQAQAQSAVFYKDSANLAQLSKIKETEENRFASEVGNMRGSYSTGYLSKSSSAGQF